MSARLVTGLILVLAAGVAVWFASRRGGSDDIEALIDATRETIPDYVPDTWVKEYGR